MRLNVDGVVHAFEAVLPSMLARKSGHFAGVASLKIEGRTKSPYYVARTCQAYRQAIDDAVAGRPFDASLLGELENLANRGYTDGFYQRHHDADYQNYLRGHSESERSLYVGDAVRFAAELGYEVTVVKDATADYSDKEMLAALEINIPNYASDWYWAGMPARSVGCVAPRSGCPR